MAAPWEEYAAATTPKAPWEEYGAGHQSVADRINNDAISQGARDFPKEGVSGAVLSLLGGGVKGATDIGTTLMDLANRKLAQPALQAVPDRFKLQTEAVPTKQETTAGIDAGLQSLGANPDSLLFKGGRLTTQVAGTAGVGSALAVPLRAAGGPITQAIASGLESGGFRVPGLSGPPLAAVRVGTGAAAGGASAGLVNPDDAGTGALIGAAMPAGVALAGKAGDAIGSLFPKGPTANARTLDTARQSIDAGYVIPPNMVNPSLKNQIIESISGKQATQQIASTKNTQVTEGLVKQALGLPEDAQLTQATMESLRKTAGKAYADVSSLSPQAASDLEALKQARNDASAWFKSYNRTASPEDLAKAKDFRATADNLENLLEFHALQAGRNDLIPALRDARKQIAKTYTVGRALNDASGTVDARVLGRMSEKGLPLSDGLDIAGQFASAFPSIAKSPQQVGSPAAHNLKALASMGLGLGGHAALGPFGIGSAALPFVAPPLARSIMFSKGAQQGLLSTAQQEPIGLLTGASRVLPVAVPSLLGP